jgi:hypothetical protein
MKAFRFESEVDSRGRIQLPKLRFTRVAKVEVIVLEHEQNTVDLLKAAESTLAFWENPIDDEVWNAA